jgi:hypothetical protein
MRAPQPLTHAPRLPSHAVVHASPFVPFVHAPSQSFHDSLHFSKHAFHGPHLPSQPRAFHFLTSA